MTPQPPSAHFERTALRAYERLYDHYRACWRCGVVMVLDETGLCLSCEKRSERYERAQAAFEKDGADG